MPTRAIPGVTLACADCRHPGLALRAMACSLEQCRFEDAIFFTDDHFDGVPPAGVRIQRIDRIADSAGYTRFIMKTLEPFISTDFVQVIQWDGYVTNAAGWDDEYLEYDYVGAPWWFHPPPYNVGNGGFSLRSRKLLEALQSDEFEAKDPEDETVCLTYRPKLEAAYGVKFAPSHLAGRYSFEGSKPTGKEFGFHRIFNLPYFTDASQLADVMARLDDQSFCGPSTATLVKILVYLGRRREAIDYARRLRRCADFDLLPAAVRTDLRDTVFKVMANERSA